MTNIHQSIDSLFHKRQQTRESSDRNLVQTQTLGQKNGGHWMPFRNEELPGRKKVLDFLSHVLHKLK